ncbi:protein NRT1/ PTR FAMILY 6.4-like [Vitis riparia]|uniref:protein NRT1/ PTR FAMILY 6.4-like n=1 Tax=Vitis riparia TaxID=96939 RepID=UPI00155A8975|nr:protein NRT1/ PTR FAMILY 6.4-like [Vitis riparia]
MNRKIGSLVVPSGSLFVFLFISILLFTSLNETIIVPFAQKLTHNVPGVTSLQRVRIGLIFLMVAMVTAAIVERQRREVTVQHKTFWLVPQFFLVGAGEAFAYVGQLEFFIREAPDRMKSMSIGLFLSTLAMGFFVSSLLVSLVDKVLRSNLNWGKLDNFYWMLAVLGVLNFLAFLVFAMRHQYTTLQYNSSDVYGENELKKGWNEGITSEMEKKERVEGKEEP